MAINQNKPTKVKAFKKIKIETTYKYIPIIGEVLGYWRKEKEGFLGESFELHINTPLEEYDRVTINGKEINLDEKLKGK